MQSWSNSPLHKNDGVKRVEEHIIGWIMARFLFVKFLSTTMKDPSGKYVEPAEKILKSEIIFKKSQTSQIIQR